MIRGQVVSVSGRGLVGVRITRWVMCHVSCHHRVLTRHCRSDHLSEGYTMTREDGWFDFMVNGGGAATLQFGKSPFPPKIETLFAPWNEVSLSDEPMRGSQSKLVAEP